MLLVSGPLVELSTCWYGSTFVIVIKDEIVSKKNTPFGICRNPGKMNHKRLFEAFVSGHEIAFYPILERCAVQNLERVKEADEKTTASG